MAAFIDVEHALDPAYARKLGVDVDNLLVSQPDYGEQALEITNALITSGSIDVLVVDSVAALVPKAELDGEMGDSHVGLQARLMSQALRKLTGIVSKSKTSLLFINQIRDKIGVMFGNPETTPGGRALKFYSSIRLDIRRVTTIKEGDVATGLNPDGSELKSRRQGVPVAADRRQLADRPSLHDARRHRRSAVGPRILERHQQRVPVRPYRGHRIRQAAGHGQHRLHRRLR
jgi:protein RecA